MIFEWHEGWLLGNPWNRFLCLCVHYSSACICAYVSLMCQLGVHVFEQMQMQTKKIACVVTVMLFMALAVSWKGTAVSRVSVQTLFIIIIIIIINHPSSGVPGPGNALNHWPGRTWILHLKWERWRDRRDQRKEWKRQGGMERKNVGGKKIHQEEK